MAGSHSTTSSMTSTSHTLTNTPSLNFLSALTDSLNPASGMDMQALFEAIQAANRHDFLRPSASLPNASLQLAKATLDAYAGQVSDEQQLRQREANKKRKRNGDGYSAAEILKIRKLHVDGFESGQVWQQARRIITNTLQHAEDTLQELEDRNEVQTNGVNGKATTDSDVEPESASEDEDLISENLADDLDEHSGEEGDDLDEEENLDQLEDGDAMEDIDEEEFVGDGLELDQEGEEDDDESEDEAEPFIQDPNGLNDGFFSIDDFNKQTQLFEDADARADPNIDQGSDDEELDWHADPFSAKQADPKKKVKRSDDQDEGEDDEMQSDMGDDDDNDDEGGPTFGDMDLNAPEGDSDLEDNVDGDEEDDEFNANDVFYKDFFAPPRRKGASSRKSRSVRFSEPEEQDVKRAMADVRRDLFEDESDREDSEDALSDVSAGDPRSRRSAHERKQAKLAEEIRKLEAANIAKKDWTLAGEARAVQRPMNSLLEEDLDFEHAGKPIPVITPDISESIEELIKRRILAREFDEVIRRRPAAEEFANGTTRRGLVDLDDTKAKQSLAEIYEEEHVKNANPDSYVSKAEEKQQKEEKEIEQMWKEISSKLDALSSWHYTPKPVAPTLTVVSDVATISMEDAQPTTSQGVGGGDQTLAPQEVYKAGKENVERGEIVAKSGLPVARQEMTREDKSRRRRREKEKIRKAGGDGGVNGNRSGNGKKKSVKARQREDTIGHLRKGGVKVINKKGEIVDIDGNKAKAARAVSSGSFKL
ncbi:Mpp10 protein-domain-containing protein [Xylariaceae sp. FL0255]|nr:Mpp10 protein-domain-containing protein [Xylariaceae sp. FL0255]